MNLQENIQRIKSMMGVINENINLDDITFFKTSQGSKYIRMSDGRLRRWKSHHSNTGGEDKGLHGWSDMSIFVDPIYDKEANSPQFLIGKGFKIGLSKTQNGKMVVVIFDNGNWRPATWKDAYPGFIKINPENENKPLAWEYIKEPKVCYNVVDFNIINNQLKSYHFGSEVSEVSEFTDEDKKLFFPSFFNMNLQEHIRRILREETNPFKVSDPSTRIEEDRVQIRLGRNKENHFGKVQNIIISVDGEDITSENDVPDLGQMNIVINDGEIYVGNIVIPEKYRGQGIATIVYQKISDHFGLPIVNSITKGRNQLDQGGQIWKNREKFEPRNLQEHIRRILREETNIKPVLNNLINILFDGFDDIYYDWAQYNCGMGVCCDPYAVGFVLPKNNYDDYLFKLVDGNNYDDNGNYFKEIIDELPDVCYEMPDVKNPNFNFIIFYEEFAEEIEDYLGHKKNWKFKLLDLINEKFGCKATNIIFI